MFRARADARVDVGGYERVKDGGVVRVQLSERLEERIDTERRGGGLSDRSGGVLRGVFQSAQVACCEVERASQDLHGIAARGLSLAALQLRDCVGAEAGALRQLRLRQAGATAEPFE